MFSVFCFGDFCFVSFLRLLFFVFVLSVCVFVFPFPLFLSAFVFFPFSFFLFFFLYLKPLHELLASRTTNRVAGNGCWMLDARCEMLDARCRMPDAGCGMRDAGCVMPDAGCRMPDTGCWRLGNWEAGRLGGWLVVPPPTTSQHPSNRWGGELYLG